MAIDLQGLLKSAVLARLSGARPRARLPAGASARAAGAALLHGRAGDRTGRARRHKNLALHGGAGPRDRRARVSARRAAHRGRRAASRAASAAAPFALINPGAAWPNKRWPPERFGALAAAIRERFGWPSLVLWGPGEEALAAAVVAASNGAAGAGAADDDHRPVRHREGGARRGVRRHRAAAHCRARSARRSWRCSARPGPSATARGRRPTSSWRAPTAACACTSAGAAAVAAASTTFRSTRRWRPLFSAWGRHG